MGEHAVVVLVSSASWTGLKPIYMTAFGSMAYNSGLGRRTSRQCLLGKVTGPAGTTT